MSPFPLVDKARYGPWAVIAGASDGSGAEFARQLAASGINLVLIARRTALLEEIGYELRQRYQIDTRAVTIDLSAANAAAQMISACEGLDIGLFIANAGIDLNGRAFLDTPLDRHLDLVAINVLFQVQAVHHFAGPMRARQRGGIVLVASAAALGGAPNVSIYSGVKAFQLNFGESLWAELRHDNVSVIVTAAPSMPTPALLSVLEERQGAALILVETEVVVAETLRQLQNGPCLIYGMPNDQTAEIRRDRVVSVEKYVRSVYGDAS